MEHLKFNTSAKAGRFAKQIVGKAGKSGKLVMDVFVQVRGNSRSRKVPKEVNEAIKQILLLMEQGKAIAILSSETEMSTQEAANVLKFSRPYVVKLLEAGKIPFRKVGKHRRVLLRDVLSYQRIFEGTRKAGMQFLADQAQDLKLGYE